ncbi:MAG: hypothetical protein RLZZ574_718, partial [Cyanobacteriota bacterium]
YQEILDFSSIDNPILHEFIAEAKIVALWRTDKKDLALSFVETQIESCLKANQSVFILRKAQILAGLGEFNEAIKIGKKLALILQIVEMDKKPDINQVFYKKYVAEFLSLLGENKLAYATALTGFKDATILNDEPLRIEFLSILANCEDSKDWEKCLQELYKNTFYWHLMNRESLNSSILNHFNSLYQSLIIWAEHCIVE